MLPGDLAVTAGNKWHETETRIQGVREEHIDALASVVVDLINLRQLAYMEQWPE